MEEKKLKKKEIDKKFELAKIYLKSAKNSLEAGDIRLATDAAYNAAELVMKAAILLEKETIPRRHGGVAQLFSLLYIKNGTLRKKLGGVISEGLELRNKSRYEVDTKITNYHASHNIKLTEELIRFFEEKI